jgi:hypothetical protein
MNGDRRPEAAYPCIAGMGRQGDLDEPKGRKGKGNCDLFAYSSGFSFSPFWNQLLLDSPSKIPS